MLALGCALAGAAVEVLPNENEGLLAEPFAADGAAKLLLEVDGCDVEEGAVAVFVGAPKEKSDLLGCGWVALDGGTAPAGFVEAF